MQCNGAEAYQSPAVAIQAQIQVCLQGLLADLAQQLSLFAVLSKHPAGSAHFKASAVCSVQVIL